MNQELNELTQAIPGVVYQFRVNPNGSCLVLMKNIQQH
jgi:hypothetical protein